MTKQVKINVQGRVQGVFYRASTLNRAVLLRLFGTVKNLNDGSVEIVCQGGEEQIKEMVSWCWTGPSASKVSNVTFTEMAISQLSDFQVLY